MLPLECIRTAFMLPAESTFCLHTLKTTKTRFCSSFDSPLLTLVQTSGAQLPLAVITSLAMITTQTTVARLLSLALLF